MPAGKRGNGALVHACGPYARVRSRVGATLVVAVLALGCAAAISLPVFAAGAAADASAAAGTAAKAGPNLLDGANGWWGDKHTLAQDPSLGQSIDLPSGYVAKDHIPVEAGRRYAISLSMLAENADPNTVFVQASFRGPGADQSWKGAARIRQPWGEEAAVAVDNTPGAWQHASAVIEAPEHANEMVLYLRKLPNSKGVARFARVAVTQTAGQATSRADLALAQLRQKVLTAPASAATRDAQATRLKAAVRSPAAPTLQVARNRQAALHIYVDSHADLTTLFAAKELADALHRVTGGTFLPLATETTPPLSGPVIVVGGDSALAKTACPTKPGDAARASDDAFRFCAAGENLVLAGNTPRGTLYAVYWWLDRVVGVKWLAPDATEYPSQPDLSVTLANETHTPRFAYREVLSHEAEDMPFRAHNLMDGMSHGTSYRPSPPELDVWDRSWLAKDGDASFWDLVPPDRYRAQHPDWFAGGQLAMMNPDVRSTMADSVRARLGRIDYKTVWFGIHDMDWGWDMDAASQQFAGQHGGRASAPLVDMVSDVATKVAATMPGARFAMNAYHWGFRPPAGLKVPENVLVYPMTIQADFSTPLGAGRNREMGDDLRAWNGIAKHLLLWDHIANFNGLIQPTPNLYAIAGNIRFLAGLDHFDGYFAEGSWMTPGAEFASLRAWLIARLLWEPDQNVDALIDTWCRGYFGAAGADVARYIKLEHAALAKTGEPLGERAPLAMKMFDEPFLEQADALFDQAEHAVQGDATRLARVRLARMPLDYTILVLTNDDAVAKRTNGRWDAGRDARMTRFRQSLAAAHVGAFRQDGDLKMLDALLAARRTIAKPPPEVAERAAGDWADLQDLQMNLYSNAHIAADPLASDNASIEMSGGSGIWAVQFKLDRLPPQGQWDVYASIRSGKCDANAPGEIRVGSSPPMNCFNAVPMRELSCKTYRTVKVAGGPFANVFDHERGIYLQADGTAADQHIYLDRMFAVKASDATAASPKQTCTK